ncbi:MAG: hypothetical protein OXD32_05225 [Endozoicomonadaceae bacterium]|nr:hypothetical protein [Endozoicomonadaceae bacterium]MCY4330118.1 hypothetical protein [Endozoicomonadaceae bacterium]
MSADAGEECRESLTTWLSVCNKYPLAMHLFYDFTLCKYKLKFSNYLLKKWSDNNGYEAY